MGEGCLGDGTDGRVEGTMAKADRLTLDDTSSAVTGGDRRWLVNQTSAAIQ